MAATVTAADLIAAYPEWSAVQSSQPAVVTNILAVANAMALPLYTDTDEEIDRRLLEACANLFAHPFGRDMSKYNPADNWYRVEATRRDVLKGTAYRAPGWSLPSGVS